MAKTERECIVEVLRTIAPGHAIGRIWGRFEGATAHQAHEGNAWAADPEDVADLILKALAENRGGDDV